MPAVLGVERSITGKRWLHRGAEGDEAERAALAMAQRHGLPDIVARILAARGIPLDDVERFLNPTLRAELPDPSSLKGMVEAVERLAVAIRDGETIGLFADYDVDGAASQTEFVLDAYRQAVADRYRFFSYGDAMLIT